MNLEALKRMRILVVDDEQQSVRLLERFLERDGYTDVHTLTDSRKVVSTFDELDPDLVILDLNMPHVSGRMVLEFIGASVPATSYLPVLVLTGDATPEARNQALVLGAKDFLTKPFDLMEARYRIRNLLHTRFLHLELGQRNEALEQRVTERTIELRRAHLDTLERLAQVAEYSDDQTGMHCRRVGELAARMGALMGLPTERVSLLRRAAQLHDVGKIAIPEAIRLKPGKLTDEEFDVMRTHTTIGARILSGGSTELMTLAEAIALGHHERWDGTGYPRALQGEAIPLEARIVAVADFFDALASDRPYRRAWPVTEIVEEIRRQSGQAFDPAVVQAFMKLPILPDTPAQLGEVA